MKYNIVSSVLILAGMFSSVTRATDVNLTGRVVASPCVVDTASVTQDIDFGRVQKKDLRVAGSAGEWHPFQITLTRCPAATRSVTATFSGMPFSGDTTLYANAGSAQGVAIQMVQVGDKSKVQGHGSSMTVGVDAQHNATYALAGRVISPEGEVEQGSVSSIVQISFTYG